VTLTFRLCVLFYFRSFSFLGFLWSLLQPTWIGVKRALGSTILAFFFVLSDCASETLSGWSRFIPDFFLLSVPTFTRFLFQSMSLRCDYGSTFQTSYIDDLASTLLFLGFSTLELLLAFFAVVDF